MIYYKLDIIQELKKRGYDSVKIRKSGVISQATLQNLRHNKPVNLATLDILCKLLNKQPGAIIGYKDDGATDQDIKPDQV